MESIRLNKYLSDAGICSRRQAARWIEEKRITVNGEIAGMGMKVAPDSKVCLDGKLIKKEENSEKETTLSQTEGATYLYTDGEAVYYCTWNDRESSEEGYVERIDKKGEKRELFRIP